MAKLWSVKFKGADEPVQACACTAFGAVVNARNRTGWFDRPVDCVSLIREIDIYTAETVVDYSKLTVRIHDNGNEEEETE